MKLQKFEIKNYRSCLTTKIELLSNPTCLIGINGVGKSNILNGLLLFKKIFTGRRYYGGNRRTSSSLSKLNTELVYQNKVVKLKCEFQYEADEKNSDTVTNITFKVNLKDFTKSNKWIEVPLHLFEINRELLNDLTPQYISRHYRYTESQYIYFNNKIIRKLLQDLFSFLTSISYYSASQFSDPSKCPVSFELEEVRMRNPNRFTNSSHEKFIQELYRTSKNNKTLFDKYISLVNSSGIDLIEDISFNQYEMPSSSYEVRSGGKIRKIDKSRLLIIPSVTIDKSTLSFNQLSEGTFKTLALIFYIITDKSPLLLIEEPEVCVHHGLLNSIISLILIESKKKQIVVSTHSDFVLDKLNPENIVLVKKEKGKGTVANSLQKTMSSNDFKALKQYLLSTGNLGEYWKEGGFEHEK